MKPHPISRARRGATLIEIMITMTLLTVILLSSMAMVESGRRFSQSTIGISTAEEFSQQMLFKVENELSNASGLELTGVLSSAFAGDAVDGLELDSTLGFPPRGRLLLGRGTAVEERIEYARLDGDQETIGAITRGIHCTKAFPHAKQSELIWMGLAEPLPREAQDNPPASEWDGRAEENGEEVFFRGDGTGFAYRVPIDPAGDGNYLNGDDLFWGAKLSTGVTLTGYHVLYYDPKTTISEAESLEDLNEDGDQDDIFDVGQIRRLSWDATDPTGQVDDVGLGPTVLLQEQCNWGGDLDGDGFDDPIFLWDKDTNQLHVRLFVLGWAMKQMPIVREVDSVMFLRNEPEL